MKPLDESSRGLDALRQKKYRDLARKHLDTLLNRLFVEFTGLHFHVAWAPPPPQEWEEWTLPSACSVCGRMRGSGQGQECRMCGTKHLMRALAMENPGHRFTCRLGVWNYWLPIRIRGEVLGIAYLQTLSHKGRSAAERAPAPGARAKVLSRPKFARAGRFLRHIIQHVQTASLSDLRKADLSSAGRAVIALEREQTRLQEALHTQLPPAPLVSRSSGPESHAQQVVYGLLRRIELDYPHPITLQQSARELGMNAAYLSTLFSSAVGIPFKTYLTEVRIQKAKELLGDAATTASEVAFAVGYVSEERFRCAFKKATGLSPKVWRETIKATQPDRSAPNQNKRGVFQTFAR